jgi:plasmid stabilization system protein ParE
MAEASIPFHRLALQEYEKAWRWYARRSPKAAERFLQAVDKCVQEIANDPFAGLYMTIFIAGGGCTSSRGFSTTKSPLAVYQSSLHFHMAAVGQAIGDDGESSAALSLFR